MTTAPSIISYAVFSAALPSGEIWKPHIFPGTSFALVPNFEPRLEKHNVKVLHRLMHCEQVPPPPVPPLATISTSAPGNPFAMHILPAGDGYVTVNSRQIFEFTELHDGDRISIGQCADISVWFRGREIPSKFETRETCPPDQNGAIAPPRQGDTAFAPATFAVSGKIFTEAEGSSLQRLATPPYVRQMASRTPSAAEFLSAHAPPGSRTEGLLAAVIPDGKSLVDASAEDLMGFLSDALQRVIDGRTGEPEIDLYQLVRAAGLAISAGLPYIRCEIKRGPRRPFAGANRCLGRLVDVQGIFERLGRLHEIIGRPFTHYLGVIPKEEDMAVTIADVLNNMMASLRGHVEHGARVASRGGPALDWGILYDSRIEGCDRFNRPGRFALAQFLRDTICECSQRGLFIVEDIDRYSRFTGQTLFSEQTMLSWWMLLDALAARPAEWLSPEECIIQ